MQMKSVLDNNLAKAIAIAGSEQPSGRNFLFPTTSPVASDEAPYTTATPVQALQGVPQQSDQPTGAALAKELNLRPADVKTAGQVWS